ncbi:MAG: transcriptional repressor LexA [Phycisphaerae bacterium]|jgi:repressor LexA|nr:transcriptional repressor LexA [Phycisphaerae bacterium]MBT5383210.1 transcriptional repressor LexA [Phycisphaerae bacterium]MBT5656278.1 transcriptional repressor LexA [Phycisphaerae bacterium]
MNLTPRQLHIVQLIRDSRVARGYSPTIQELADEIGVAKVTVHEHVGALVKKGVLQKEPNKARSLSLVEGLPLPNEDNGVRFPLIGRIAAGLPIEQFEQSDTLDLESVFGPRVGEVGSTFALQVTGDSMQDEGILDGDYVIVRRASTARAGERVVALLPNGETTLKSFYREPDGRIRLQPANDAFEPIIVNECQIQGIVVGVMRRYDR